MIKLLWHGPEDLAGLITILGSFAVQQSFQVLFNRSPDAFRYRHSYPLLIFPKPIEVVVINPHGILLTSFRLEETTLSLLHDLERIQIHDAISRIIFYVCS